MVNSESHTHLQRLSSLMFDCSSGRIPDWLSAQAQLCAKRYAGLRTTPEFAMALNGFSQRGTEPFEIFVVGEGNFGKSTLINALLGEEICKVNILPETRTFHRLILSRNPSKTVRLLVHAEANQHEWLRKEIGSGKTAQGFFEVMEHRVPLEIARGLLVEEASRVKKSQGLYKPAIFELEQEIHWTRASPFPERVRIVDTQGLNQQLPDDLQQYVLKEAGRNTADKVVSRLNQTVRGRHMLWQYRRCDAALWLLRADSIQSAATNALFNVFSAYGKKTLLVVTRLDEISPNDHKRIMRVAEQSYGSRVDGIVAVNGKQALEGALKRTREVGRARELEGTSGMTTLREQIHDLCVVRGLQTKAIGLYNSLRATESDLRKALKQFSDKLETTIHLLEEHKQSANKMGKDSMSHLESELAKAGSSARADLDQRVRSIGFWDGAANADEKIAFHSVCVKYQDDANKALKEKDAELKKLMAQLQATPYALPVFDPLGNRAGESLSVKAIVDLKQLSIQIRELRLKLDRSIIDSMEGYFLDIVSILPRWLLPDAVYYGIKREHQRKLDEINERVHKQCDPALNDLIVSSEKKIKEEFRQGIKKIEDAIQRVEEKLTSVEREPLKLTKKRLEEMLTDRAMKSTIAYQSVSVFQSLARGHQRRTMVLS